MTMIKLLYLLIVAIPAWIATARLRRRARRALGRNISDQELTSINTWMEVEEREQQQRGYSVSSSDNAHVK